jgi:hypothetical protein
MKRLYCLNESLGGQDYRYRTFKGGFMQKKRNLVLVFIAVVTLVASFAFADPGTGLGPGGRGTGPGICKHCK